MLTYVGASLTEMRRSYGDIPELSLLVGAAEGALPESVAAHDGATHVRGSTTQLSA